MKALEDVHDQVDADDHEAGMITTPCTSGKVALEDALVEQPADAPATRRSPR